jgi:hypothetical protein
MWTRDSNLQFYAIERDASGNFITNSVVQWSLEGTAGTLTVQGGGRSALFDPNTSGSAKVTYTVKDLSSSLNITVNYNEAPVVTLTTPSVSLNTVLETDSFALQWADADVDDDADISFYYSPNSSGDCDDSNLIVSGVSENSGTDLYNWDTTGVVPGVYYICAVAEDQVGKVVSWNAQALTVTDNNPPAFSFVLPVSTESNTIVPNSTGINITWTDNDPEEDASINLYYKTVSSGACNTGTLLTSTTEDSAVDNFSWDTTLMPSDEYYICASLDDGFNPVVEIHSSKISVSRTCNWLGASSVYEASSNWANCDSTTPQGTDYILLTATGNDPVVSSDVSTFGIAPGGTQQEIIISSGSKITFNSDINFQSSVTLKGDSTTCNDCEVSLWGDDSFVLNNSTLRLEPGITVYSATSSLDFGDGVTSGHLEIVGGGIPAERVNVLSDGAWGFRGFVFNGTAGIKSTANVSNANITYYHGYSSGDTLGFHFKDHYEVLGLDDVTFGGDYGDSNTESITFENCANGVFTDSDFSNLEYKMHFNSRSSNINMNPTNCTSIPVAGTITMTGASGWGFGSVFEVDANNLVTWFNETGGTCSWTGATDSNWFEPNNWSGCINGRGGYPDQFNTVVIDNVPVNQPILVDKIVIQGFATTGTNSGGKITINSGGRLWIAGSEVRSDIVFTGNPDNCTDCEIGYETLSILDGATFSLERGLRLTPRDSLTVFNVGDGFTAGHLVINPNSSDQTHWPKVKPSSYYNEGIKVEGVSGMNTSSVFINGFISPMHSGGNYAIRFENFYEIKNFDNYIIESAFGWDMTNSRVEINNCSDGLFTDKTWDQIDFFSPPEDPFSDAYNIEFSNCNGTGIGPINITPMSGGTNAGFGEVNALDPENFLIWSP